MLKEQDVVVARLQQRPLEVVRLGETDAAQVSPAQHLALARQVEATEQLGDALEVARRDR